MYNGEFVGWAIPFPPTEHFSKRRTQFDKAVIRIGLFALDVAQYVPAEHLAVIEPEFGIRQRRMSAACFV